MFESSERIEAVLKGTGNVGGALLDRLRHACHLSRFVLASLEKNPAYVGELAVSGRWDGGTAREEFRLIVEEALTGAQTEADFMSALRRVRNREQVRFIFRDLNGLCSVPELTLELSDFADVCIQAALDFSMRQLMADHGEPMGEYSGKPQRMSVIGMGKLGAQELNLSSDIDLIFCYPEAGETTGPRVLSNSEFFVRLGQRIVKLLDVVTADGFVFRVDMRLRPWGDGSPLASSFAGMEAYYEQHGREWERYALIKARIVAGAMETGQELMDALRPFVFRKYIDFGAFESLREMKDMIAREVRRKGTLDNVKLGEGGIREVEFIAQAFQLIRGGVDRRLQERQVLKVIPMLGEEGLIPPQAVDELCEAYHFLRRVEHRIQALEDMQTQLLPTSDQDRHRIAVGMGFDAWESFYAVLHDHRSKVQSYFNDVIVVRKQEESPDEEGGAAQLWADVIDEPEDWLVGAGFESPADSLARLRGLRENRAVAHLPRVSRERLDKFMPLLVAACTRSAHPDLALVRTLPLVESVLRRTAYLMLLIENRGALQRLVDLCVASPWIAEELARYPVLLDELLNAGTLYAPPSREELQSQLRAQLARLPEDDLEAQMDVLRIFQKGQVLRVAASDITGSLPLMKISDYLSWIAESVLAEVLNLCWRELTARHGRPRRSDGSVCDLDFVIVGYGKLGGIELGYGSDLDLVFIHGADPQEETDGPRPVDGATFYARLGQKIIHVLTAPMSSGTVYDIDMRLRPSGSSGMLVTSLGAFARYQREVAWVWEHQALVRARVVAGDARLAAGFEEVRREVLARVREPGKLAPEVTSMRAKMREHLSSEATGNKDPGFFHLKQDRGGIVDIEFMVQYGVLAWAHEHPELTRFTDNVRILEGFANLHLLPEDDADGLKEAYLAYRACGHRLALANTAGKVPDSEFTSERALVERMWRTLIEQN